MKGTDHFKRTIYMYLEQRAEEDALFAKKYRNPAKNMDECVTHILNYVQKSGCNGFTDGEIFGQAIHYYEENEIEVGKPMDCQVVVNHVVKLTAEEKAEARQNAVRKYQAVLGYSEQWMTEYVHTIVMLAKKEPKKNSEQ